MDINKMQEMEKSESIPFGEIPESFEGVLTAEDVRQDEYKANCLFWTISVKGDDRPIIQKFTPSQISRIRQFAEANGIKNTDALIGKTMGFKKVISANKNANPRWYPVAIL